MAVGQDELNCKSMAMVKDELWLRMSCKSMAVGGVCWLCINHISGG